ncbi:hypothetical protein [Ammoniphilus sp. 3BR4]|uniref:hypothetical protein n=1 Tax=Ammoniphilus sp. 3BR4 TaxID=3158265 RepID=UPI003464FD07
MSFMINRLPITLLRSSAILLLALFYLLHYFFPTILLYWIFTLMLGSSFLFGFYYLNKTTKTLCLIMLLIGHILFFVSGGTAAFWMDSLTKNMPLVTFLILIPLLSIPFKVEGHFQAIQEVTTGRLEGRQKFYSVVSFLTFTLCIMMNVGGMRLNYEMLEGYFKKYTQTGVQAMMRGYAATMLWAPYFPTVILILFYLQIPSYAYLGPALGFGLLSLIFLNLYGWMAHRKLEDMENRSTVNRQPLSDTGKRKLTVFIGLVLLIIFLSVFLERWGGFPIMIVIALISIGFPAVMVTLSQRRGAYKEAVTDYRVQALPKMINEVSLFISAGFLGEMVAKTDIGEIFPAFFTTVSGLSLWLMIFLLIVIIPLLAIVGIHPLVTGSILGTSLSPELIGLNPISLAGALIGGWAMALMLSPISAINIIVGGMVDKPPFVVGLKWNWKYGLWWAFLLAALLYGYHHMA